MHAKLIIYLVCYLFIAIYRRKKRCIRFKRKDGDPDASEEDEDNEEDASDVDYDDDGDHSRSLHTLDSAAGGEAGGGRDLSPISFGDDYSNGGPTSHLAGNPSSPLPSAFLRLPSNVNDGKPTPPKLSCYDGVPPPSLSLSNGGPVIHSHDFAVGNKMAAKRGTSGALTQVGCVT